MTLLPMTEGAADERRRHVNTSPERTSRRAIEKHQSAVPVSIAHSSRSDDSICLTAAITT